MKKTIISGIVLAALFTGCSSDEPKLDFCDNELSNVMSKRTIDDAISIADQYASNVGSSSRSTALKVDKSNISAIVSTTSRALSDTLMYVVNYEDNNGYLIISASKATEPILAIIDSGNYQEDEQVNVEGFDFFMENALNYVATADGVTGSNDEGPDDKIMTWYNDTVVLVHPVLPYKVNVKWGQKWPENVYCPNKIAGCAPVAIAQLLSYFKPEMSFDVTFEGRPCDHMTIDWNEILKHKTSYNSIERPFFDPVACQGCTVAHEQLAVLLRQIGVWAHSTYEFDIDNNPTVTSTDIGYLYSVTDMLLPNCMKSFVDTGRIYDDMGEGIALVTGVTINESNTLESHAWIIDGKGSITYRITLYTYYNPKTGEYATREFKSETAKYLHCNWGWRGVYNGYFLENAFNTNSGRDFPIVVPVGPVTLGANTISSRSTYLGVYGYAYH